MLVLVFAAALATLQLVDARRHKKLQNWDFDAEMIKSADDPLTHWFHEQRLDHFNPINRQTWSQRYFVNDSFFDGTGPVFLCVGGEGPPLQTDVVVNGSVHCGWMVILAQRHRALIVAIEHRFYGLSIPTPDFSTNNLEYLTTYQALADTAHFHTHLSQRRNLTSLNKWVTFGGSYPGMQAGWLRLKYPNLFHASIASSAPVGAIANFQGYNDVVADSMSAEIVGGSAQCAQAIKTAFSTIGSMLQSSSGITSLESMFNVCPHTSLKPSLNQMTFIETISAVFPVQENDPSCTELACNIASVCNIMLNGSDNLQNLVLLNQINYGSSCIDVSFNNSMFGYLNTTIHGGVDRIWQFQTCTMYGFYQTCDPGTKCLFTSDPWLLTLESNFDICQLAFNITPSQIHEAIATTNGYFGGRQPQGTRILFVNGQIDPWHARSVLTEVSPNEPTLWVKGASHHFWTHPPLPTDSVYIQEAREKIAEWVDLWLTEE